MSSITELLDELQIKILDMEDKLEDLDRATRRLRQERDEATSELPRSISADDLREGMQVAYCVPRGNWETCTVQRSADGTGEGFKDPTWGRRVFGIEDTIVLLEDAPEPEQPTTTVADLEAAPVGSRLSEGGVEEISRIKVNDGTWARASEDGRPCTKSGVSSGQIWGLRDRTLTYPEPEEMTSEDIRASEPGSTFEDREGDTWEWTGQRLDLHTPGGVGRGDILDELFPRFGPFTRSSAPSRGDYTAKVPKVGDVISAVGELESLPAFSVVIDKDGDPFRKSGGGGVWFTTGDREPWDFDEMSLPIKLVHVGGEGE